MYDPIDFVITWVDGADPDWQMKRDSFLSENRSEHDNSAARFRDWDLLKYWFRAVEAYTPWVHKVFLVTSGQHPEWLNLDCDKLQLVDHTDFIPKEYLPVFSSRPIELNFHRIKDLSECFVYFNDDMYINRNMSSSDFFVSGKPRDSAILSSFVATGGKEAHLHAVCNVFSFINEHFNKHEVMKQNFRKWFSLKYGKKLLKNIYFAATRGFSNLENSHLPNSLLKSTYETVWALDPELLETTCRHKFRDFSDVNQYIMKYYNICSGNFEPCSPNRGHAYQPGMNSAELYEDLLSQKSKMICINDYNGPFDFEAEKTALQKVFEKKLSSKSSFEK